MVNVGHSFGALSFVDLKQEEVGRIGLGGGTKGQAAAEAIGGPRGASLTCEPRGGRPPRRPVHSYYESVGLP